MTPIREGGPTPEMGIKPEETEIKASTPEQPQQRQDTETKETKEQEIIRENQEEAMHAFNVLLKRLGAAREFIVLKNALEASSKKGYEFTRPGRMEGFVEMSPYCLRSTILELFQQRKPNTVEDFDNNMGWLKKENQPWEELKKALEAAMQKRSKESEEQFGIKTEW